VPARAGTPPKPPPPGRLIPRRSGGWSDAAVTGQDIAICGGASLPR
jgi:hypothetical protein